MPHANVSIGLALYQPDIPQNCGTMLRLCACLGLDAALIEPAGFPMSDRHFRRAGMDYLHQLDVKRHASFAMFEAWRGATGRRLVLLTTHADLAYTSAVFEPGDILMVGRESAGVPADVHAAADLSVVVPMRPPSRSLNVAVAAAMVVGEALRQVSADFGRGAARRVYGDQPTDPHDAPCTFAEFEQHSKNKSIADLPCE